MLMNLLYVETYLRIVVWIKVLQTDNMFDFSYDDDFIIEN